MNINPRTWFPARKSNDIGSGAIARAATAMGPWQQALNGFVPREVNPWFLEALRSSLGVLDGAMNRLVTVDGIIDVEGGNDKLVQLIQRELIAGIPVNDLQGGLQAFYAGQGNELYEQGFTVAEMVYDRRGRELIGLQVADSKGVLFHRDPDSGQLQTWYLPPMANATGRRDGTDAVETVLRNTAQQLNVALIQGKGYTLVAPERMIYSAFNPENGQPYGVSLLRGIEFVSQILLKMHNATGQAWERFGDPVFHVNYKTKNRALKSDALDKRRQMLASDLHAALTAKRLGNSADFTTAVGADDEITVTIIGGDGKVLSIEMPARHMLEQILAKTGLPAWMLGMQFSTAERMADNQAEVVLQESKTRFEARLHGLNRVVETWMRGRGLTWKPGDWNLTQKLPNLRDELKRAQAGFLNAQTELMQRGGGGNAPAGQDPASADPSGSPAKTAHEMAFSTFDDPIVRSALMKLVEQQVGKAAQCDHTKAATGEAWAIDDPNLQRIEDAAVAALGSAWNKLADDTLAVLSLPSTKAAGEVFTFDAVSMFQRLLQLQEGFIAASTSPDSELVKLALEIWVRGIENAAMAEERQGEAAAVIAAARDQRVAALPDELHAVLQKTTVRVYENDIVHALAEGAYNGENPKHVAERLRKQFTSHNYDWQRLAVSEMAHSHANGQLTGLSSLGFSQYKWRASIAACKVCEKLAADGPYVIGAGPLPVRDSHPLCKCNLSGFMA
jgi:hypothetical protein